MKLSALNPMRWNPDEKGEFDLKFDCPYCGKPYQVWIKCSVKSAANGVWQVSSLPDGVGWEDTVTITPSINYTTCGHGRKKPNCSFHGTIINGEIV